jgi:hypothetical protein
MSDTTPKSLLKYLTQIPSEDVEECKAIVAKLEEKTGEHLSLESVFSWVEFERTDWRGKKRFSEVVRKFLGKETYEEAERKGVIFSVLVEKVGLPNGEKLINV